MRQDVSGPEAAARPDRLGSLVGGTSIDAALEFFDSLPAVEIEEMLGVWKGAGFDTGNPFDGVLESFGWHGKRFDGVDHVYPLVMQDAVAPPLTVVDLELRRRAPDMTGD